MVQQMLEALFWLSIVALVYGYAGFPLLVAVAGRVRARDVKRAPVTPTATLIIAAYNEEEEIARRMDNALAMDYPAAALEIIVVSDGSTDATADIVGEYASRGVRLLELPRQGKIPALNEAVKHASGEILVFSDANIHCDPQALRMLARNFADSAVGGVAGNSTYRPPVDGESSSRGEGLYWRYDSWLKEMESRTGSVVSAHGGLYALRRELYAPPGESAVTDDFAISTAVVEQGRRLVFDREALAYESTIAESNREFQRKVRLMTRGWRAVALRRRLLNPFRYGFYSLVLASHKVLRRLLPLVLLVMFASSLLLASSGGLYFLAAAAQLAFYSLAAVGYFARRVPAGRLRIILIPFYFCLANAAALVAFGRFLIGTRISLWEPQRHGSLPDGREQPQLEVSGGLSRRRAAAGRPRAIVIGLDCPTGLQTARILAYRGVPVIGVASDPRHPCARTNVCERVVASSTSDYRLVETLRSIGETLDARAVIVTCTDMSVLLTSRHRDELAQWFHLVLPTPDVVEMLVDKARFYSFAQQHDLPLPPTYFLDSREAALDAARELRFPAILKPAVKTPEWALHTSVKAYQAETPDEFMRLYDRCSPWTPTLIAQEWIAGEDTDHYTCNAYFGSGSEPLVTLTTRKLRQWPPTGGQACLSVECDDETVRAATVRLFQMVQHRGLAYLEMKRDARTGEYLIIEPNVGRPTGRSATAEAAGIELLLTMYRDALGWPLPEERIQKYRGTKWIHLRRDLLSAFHHSRRGELTLRGCAQSWRGPMVEALFSWRDPVPFWADLWRVTRSGAVRARVPRTSPARTTEEQCSVPA